jgi:hypothetical protein
VYLLLAGYGDGAFSTLRCKFDISTETVSLKRQALFYRGGYADAGLVVTGRTDKVGAGTADGTVRLTLADMSPDEALVLARRLLDYALLPHRKFKADKPRSANKTYMPIDE